MHLARKDKVILFVIITLVVLIPTGSYVLSQRINSTSHAENQPTPKPVTSLKKSSEVPKLSPAELLKQQLASSSGSTAVPTPEPIAQIYFGPTLGFKLKLQGRPSINQAAKIFLGIAQGNPGNNPQYLLSFMVDIPASGQYSGLSLAGLTQGQTYTAYIKGPAQIATAAAFVVKPTPSDLGVLNLITGDVNEDNIIDQNDYNIVKGAFNATPNSPKWNSNLDFNLDNIVNLLDLMYVNVNLNKVGASGVWYSKPSLASKSAELQTPSSIGGAGGTSTGGYWQWIPRID